VSDTVFIVDDDADVRDALRRLIEVDGHRVKTYPSAEAFLVDMPDVQQGCIILDLRLPQMTGPQLQRWLYARRIRIPIIFLSGHADVATAVSALRSGAFHFLEKPVAGALLLECVRAALHDCPQSPTPEMERQRLQERFEGLTARERSVMNLVVSGHSNRDIGRLLHISHRTVEVHRRRVMHKMQARTLLALAGYAKALERPQLAGELAMPASHQLTGGQAEIRRR
jgi:FixJ family two-component response regulator